MTFAEIWSGIVLFMKLLSEAMPLLQSFLVKRQQAQIAAAEQAVETEVDHEVAAGRPSNDFWKEKAP